MAKLPFPQLAQTIWTIRRINRILWVRVALITALSVLAAFSAELFDRFIPDGPKDRFSASASLPILNILANGMLAVATFSLGVMVSSHRTLANQSTPRIHRILMEDTRTQTTLATFIGAFVFSLSAIILFRAGYYSDSAAVIVFGATVFVVLAIVVSLVRWIGQLTRIGSLEYALDRAENAARETLTRMRQAPQLGGVLRDKEAEPPSEATEIIAESSGYLNRIDMDDLQGCAEKANAEIIVDVLPGARILKGQTLGWITKGADTEGLTESFLLDASRSVEQDPRYAMIVLREAASKALSPGINDQGTAIEVIARLERLLWDWSDPERDDSPNPIFDRIHVPALSAGLLIIHAFRGIARDGAGQDQVLIMMIDALKRLRTRMPQDAHDAMDTVLADIDAHADAALGTDRQKDRVRKALSEAGFDHASA